jgi:catechol 1,2-dioxygenase
MVRLLGDLFKAVEDLDLTPKGIWNGIEYFADADAGASHEPSLLAAGLGLERFLDIRADEADARAGLAGCTPRTIEGPLYVAGAPESTGYARLDDGTEREQGEVLFMQGTVFDAKGAPLPNAKVEVWHANLLGNYSFFDKSQPVFNLRRTILTDAEGRYSFRSIMPRGVWLSAGRHHPGAAEEAWPPRPASGTRALFCQRGRPPAPDHADQYR